VHFYPVAAWSQEGTLAFNTTAPRSSPNDTTAIGAHLQMQNSERKKAEASTEASLISENRDTRVRTVNLASFIDSLPAGSVQIMKMDIEGAEWETLAEMLKEDILCKETIASAYIETHGWGETSSWGTRADFKIGRPRCFDALQEKMAAFDASAHCVGAVTNVFSLDDETYPHDVDDDFLGRGSASSAPSVPAVIVEAPASAEASEALASDNEKHLQALADSGAPAGTEPSPTEIFAADSPNDGDGVSAAEAPPAKAFVASVPDDDDDKAASNEAPGAEAFAATAPAVGEASPVEAPNDSNKVSASENNSAEVSEVTAPDNDEFSEAEKPLDEIGAATIPHNNNSFPGEAPPAEVFEAAAPSDDEVSETDTSPDKVFAVATPDDNEASAADSSPVEAFAATAHDSEEASVAEAHPAEASPLDDETMLHDVDDHVSRSKAPSTKPARADDSAIPGATGNWADVLSAGDGNMSNLLSANASELVANANESADLHSVNGAASADAKSSLYFVDGHAAVADMSPTSLKSLHSDLVSAESNATRDAELRLETVLRSMEVRSSGEDSKNRSMAEMVDDLLSLKQGGEQSAQDVGGAHLLSSEESSPLGDRTETQPVVAEVGHRISNDDIDAVPFEAIDAGPSGAIRADDGVVRAEQAGVSAVGATANLTSKVGAIAKRRIARHSVHRAAPTMNKSWANTTHSVAKHGRSTAVLGDSRVNTTHSVVSLGRSTAVAALRGMSAALDRTIVHGSQASGTAPDSAVPGNATEVLRRAAKALRATRAPLSDLDDQKASVPQSFIVSSANISNASAAHELHASGAAQDKTASHAEKGSAAEDEVVVATYKVIDGEVVRVSESPASPPTSKETAVPKPEMQIGNQTATLLSAKRRAVGNALKNAILKAGINITSDKPPEDAADGHFL